MSPECTSGCMECLCVLHGADKFFSLHFFLLSLQRSLKVRSWMLQKLLSLKLLRNRSYRQCLKRSMKPLNSLQEALSGMLTVSFVFAVLLSSVDSWEVVGAIWSSEISSGKGGLKPGIYGRSCSEGPFQMCHSVLFTGAQPSVSVRCLLRVCPGVVAVLWTPWACQLKFCVAKLVCWNRQVPAEMQKMHIRTVRS